MDGTVLEMWLGSLWGSKASFAEESFPKPDDSCAYLAER